ncbi:MAG: hypothetical protein WAV95_13505 [Azonexus sp.]
MIHLEKTTFWLAACSALLGAVCIVLFLLQQTTDGHLLSKAIMAALVSSVSLLLGVFMVAGPFPRAACPLPCADGASVPPGAVDHGCRIGQFAHRQKVIARRLNIDVPHLCTQTGAPCAAWSLCGSAPEGLPPAPHSPADACGRPASLPIIRRPHPTPSCLALAPDAETDGLP